MNIQIFGTKKCRETAKALRFFKERGVKVHNVDLAEKGMSRGELSSVARTVPYDDLIDKEGKEYSRLNLHYIKHDIEKVLLENPLLLKTPIVRNGKSATSGYAPETWKGWIAAEKS